MSHGAQDLELAGVRNLYWVVSFLGKNWDQVNVESVFALCFVYCCKIVVFFFFSWKTWFLLLNFLEFREFQTKENQENAILFFTFCQKGFIDFQSEVCHTCRMTASVVGRLIDKYIVFLYKYAWDWVSQGCVTAAIYSARVLCPCVWCDCWNPSPESTFYLYALMGWFHRLP